MIGRRLDRDLSTAAFLAALLVAPFAAVWLRGLTFFWGDLAYLHHPWRALGAQLLQEGRLPLWNPYVYFGMPLAAVMQDGAFYPGAAPFFFFSFPTGLALYQAAHYALAAALAFLWLRSWGLRRLPACGGAALWALGGVMLSRLPFLNHLAVLALAPAFLLFFNRPLPLALCLALAYLAGYPAFLPGAALAAWALALAARRRGGLARAAAVWAAAGAGALLLSACLLLPAAELFAVSRRAGGVALAEALRMNFSPRDLAAWVSPWLVAGWDPASDWWKTAHAGFAGAAAALLGALALRARLRWAALGWLGLVGALLLAGGNAASTALWEALPPLRFVRYPGNLAYLALPALALLAAAGLERLRRPGWLAGLIVLELVVYAWGSFPAAPRGIFASPGPQVEWLQRELAGGRYLLSPRALETTGGAGIFDWKHRLYGLTNAPYRVPAAGNFGEPLVPAHNYAAMDALYGAAGAAEAALFFPWLDIRVLLAPGPLPPTPGLRPAGRPLWHAFRTEGIVGRAVWLSDDEAALLPRDFSPPPFSPRRRAAWFPNREDRYTISGFGETPGWVFFSQPRYPGWRARLESPEGAREPELEPALLAFQKARVPAGPWRLRLSYEPASFAWGRLLSWAALLALGLYWYNRLRRKNGPA